MKDCVERIPVRGSGAGCVNGSDTACDLAAENLTCRSSRQIGLRPHHPAPDVLEFRQLRVRSADCLGSFCFVADDEGGERLRAGSSFYLYDGCSPYFGLSNQRSFEIIGIDVETGCGYDHVLLAPAIDQIPG